MKKNNKAFTLIELLAIIVILAIIAVITVPIILNIIENSRKGAATDSAYGFKDAVNKYYVTELSNDSEFQLDGSYTVSNGFLNGIEIPVSGTKPSNGNLHYTKGILDGGCLTIGDYKVTFNTNGDAESTEKGSCNANDVVLTCGDDEFLYEDSCIAMPDESCFSFSDNGDGTATITGYSCEEKILFILPKLTGQNGDLQVTTIGVGAFASNGLEGVKISDSVTTIRDGAFNSNMLKSVEIPDSVTTIGIGAFSANKLESVKISNSVTTIGIGAFSANKLKSVKIPNSVITIGEGAFESNMLESVEISDGVTTIGRGAFNSNKLKSVVIPGSVTTIGDGAFSTNLLESVEVPNSVTTIGSSAFALNQLTSIKLPNTLQSVGQCIIGCSTYSETNRVQSITIGNQVITPDTDGVDGNGSFSINGISIKKYENDYLLINDNA